MNFAQGFLIASCLALAGCAAPGAKAPHGEATPAREEAIPHDLTTGQAVLAAKLYPRLAETAGASANLFISPLSLSEGLGLAVLGARGRTAAEIRALLGWDRIANPERGIAAYDRFLKETGDPKVTLAIANALWLDKDIAFLTSYLDAAAAAFGAKPQSLDFGAAPQIAADRINAWVAKETRGKIGKIVSADSFDEATAAVLTNAVWFKARWSEPFEDSRSGTFTRGDGSTVPIAMMERIAPLHYREDSEGQAVALPYGRDGRFVMEAFLPRSAAVLKKWERKLQPLSFAGGEQGSDGGFDLADIGTAPKRAILLRLPRFEARFNASVKLALAAAGMGCAFADACADFSGMAAAPLAISDVVHATYLRVDEEGTEAAAATAVIPRTVRARIVPDVPKMIVDRPFLVTIRDRASGALIFFGRIADPTPVKQAK